MPGGAVLSVLQVALSALIGGGLLFALALNFANVILRYAFRAPIYWAEEVMIFTFVWCVFLGAAVVAFRGDHLRVELFEWILPADARRVLGVFIHLVAAVVMTGEIMSEGGISKRIVQWLLTMVGGLRGGLAFATVGACEFFGAVSGSSPATVAAIGRLMYPALRQGGYEDKFALGLITSSGAIASVMPPSIVMILYGAAAEQSVAALFAGGVVPALLIGGLTAAYISWSVRKESVHEQHRFSPAAFARATREAIWALGTPLVILGGIYFGLFSPTEAAGVAGVYGIFVTMAIYREVNWRGLWRITVNSAMLTSQILIIVAASGVFSWLLTVSGIPQALIF